MSRINLDDSFLYKPRIMAGSQSHARFLMTGTYVMTANSPGVLFLDTGAVDRQLRLPPITPAAGQVYYIMNLNLSHSINVVDADGLAVATLGPGLSGAFISYTLGWAKIAEGSVSGLEANAPYYPVVHPSSGNLVGSGVPTKHGLVWADTNWWMTGDVFHMTSDDPSGQGVVVFSGTPTVGHVITLRFKWGAGAHDVSVTYTVKPGDTMNLIAQGCVAAIANNAQLFNLNGGTVVGGGIVPANPVWGGYSGGFPISYIVAAFEGFAFDFDVRPSVGLTFSYSVAPGPATEILTIATASGPGATPGVDYTPNPGLDNNPVIIFGREVLGVTPAKNSIIAAIYATAANSAASPVGTRNSNYAVLTCQILSSTVGSQRAAWIFQTTNDAGTNWANAWYIERGIHSPGALDEGPESVSTQTFNLAALGGPPATPGGNAIKLYSAFVGPDLHLFGKDHAGNIKDYNIGGASGSAAGFNTQIQYNSSGAFGASASFTWNDTTKMLSVLGEAQILKVNAALTIADIGTGYAYTQYVGSNFGGGTLRIGVEGNTGGQLMAGVPPKSGVIGTTSNDPITFGTNNAPKMVLGTTGSLFLSSGAFNSAVGFQHNSAAPLGNVLRGDGTNFVSAALSLADIPGARERLLGPRTYFVRGDGNNANNGRTDSAGGAFQTIQKAIDNAVNVLDMGGQVVTIQLSGPVASFAPAVLNQGWAGGGSIIIQGNPANSSQYSVDATGTGNHCFSIGAVLQGPLTIQHLKMTSQADGIFHVGVGTVGVNNVVFGTITTACLRASAPAAYVKVLGPVNIVAAFGNFMASQIGGVTECILQTITISPSNLAMNSSFLYASSCGLLKYAFNTLPGPPALTGPGKKWDISKNAVFEGSGGSATVPGAVAGTPVPGVPPYGGQYEA